MKTIEKTIKVMVADEVASRVETYLDNEIDRIECFIGDEDFSDKHFNYLDDYFVEDDLDYPDYSDVETLYGKPSVTVDEVYEFMCKTYNEFVNDDDAKDDLFEKLWQSCHQLIHDAVCILKTYDNEDDFEYVVPDNDDLYVEDKLIRYISTGKKEGWVTFKADCDITFDDECVEIYDVYNVAKYLYGKLK